MEYWQTIFSISENYRLNRSYDRKFMTLPMLEINQRIVNILTSIRSYEDHITHKISDLFGKEREQYKKYLEIDRNLYDASFSYRFLKRLRNYVQHHDLPIKNIGYYWASISFEPRQIAFTVTPGLHKDALLEGDSWSEVKAEIEKMDDIIDINPIIEEAFRIFTSLHSNYREYLSSDYNEAKKTITDLYDSVEDKGDKKVCLCLIESCGARVLEKQWNQHENIGIIEELILRSPKTECINFSTTLAQEHIKKLSEIAHQSRIINVSTKTANNKKGK